MSSNHKILNVGQNRGKARIWLEGQWLAVAGFTKGQTYTADVLEGAVILTIGDGPRKVAGKVKAGVTIPIIDMSGDWLPFQSGKVKIVGTPGQLVITRPETIAVIGVPAEGAAYEHSIVVGSGAVGGAS